MCESSDARIEWRSDESTLSNSWITGLLSVLFSASLSRRSTTVLYLSICEETAALSSVARTGISMPALAESVR